MKRNFFTGLILGANLLLGVFLLLGIHSTEGVGSTPGPETALVATEPFIGEISLFAGTFAPRGWAMCEGQLLPIAQHSALFSILGTTYGGDGRTTFALPDLRGRVVMHPGQGPGLSSHKLGEKGGSEAASLIRAQSGAYTLSGSAGRGQSLSNLPPYQTLNYIIALEGIYPSRN
jgi:microcystin-dependent protein